MSRSRRKGPPRRTPGALRIALIAPLVLAALARDAAALGEKRPWGELSEARSFDRPLLLSLAVNNNQVRARLLEATRRARDPQTDQRRVWASFEPS